MILKSLVIFLWLEAKHDRHYFWAHLMGGASIRSRFRHPSHQSKLNLSAEATCKDYVRGKKTAEAAPPPLLKNTCFFQSVKGLVAQAIRKRDSRESIRATHSQVKPLVF